ncbi:uncharacterized protein LOC143017726 [Oratosquilla oratoria]|uniref:uncharacterized protein LOC143017726 n=1 Tax=Oratosquilla oratoria TaxID=337810 RepID=UPI003F7642BA
MRTRNKSSLDMTTMPGYSVVTLRAAMMMVIVMCVLLAGPAMGRNPDGGGRRGDKCLQMTTCSADKGARLVEAPNWKTRSCFCDDLCARYGDCCKDANAYNPEEQARNKDVFACVHMKQFGDVYMRGHCAVDWEDAEVARLCQEGDPSTNSERKDPVIDMPVTSLSSSVTYTNSYCALCSREDPEYLVRWTPQLDCPTLHDYHRSYGNLTKEFVKRNITYNDVKLAWGLEVDGSFHTCYVDPVMPETVVHTIRNCKKSISTCAANWTDGDVAELCASYTAVVYNYDTSYRNAHCATCNRVNENATSCSNQIFTRFLPFDDFSPVSFSLLLDFSDPNGGGLVGSSCRSSEIWDPFFKKCRDVFCGRPQHEYRNGRCLPAGDFNLVSSTKPSYVPEATTPLSTSTNGSDTTESSTTTATPAPPPPTTPTTTTTTSEEPFAKGNIIIFPDETSPSRSESSQMKELPSSSTSTSSSASQTPDDSASPASLSVTDATPSTSFSSPNSSTPFTPSESTNALVGVTETEATESPTEAETRAPQTLNCLRLFLHEEDFERKPNNTIFVEKYRRTYKPDEYETHQDGILVCAPELQVDKFSATMAWVTIVGLSISSVCIVLHLLAFVVVPELRNLSGKNLASLCVALLTAYVAFILGQFGEPGKPECFVLAAVMYYFFLASFCWMNVMAFDIWRTLRMATSELRVSTGRQWKKFVAYSFYGWILPAAALGTLVAIDLQRPEEVSRAYLPMMGEFRCWFGQRKALLVFFAAPLATIMAFNIILFIFAVRMVAASTQSTAKMTSCSPQQQDQFKLYMRLALLMGLTWISGIVAGYLNLEPIWYIFVVLNSFQGLFIFLAFTCTRKVWHSIRGTFCDRLSVGPRASWRANASSVSTSSRKQLDSRDSNDSHLSHSSHTSISHLTPSKTSVESL